MIFASLGQVHSRTAIPAPRTTTNRKLTSVSVIVTERWGKIEPSLHILQKLCQIITGLLKIKESISPVLAEISHNTRKKRRINIRKKRTSFFSDVGYTVADDMRFQTS